MHTFHMHLNSFLDFFCKRSSMSVKVISLKAYYIRVRLRLTIIRLLVLFLALQLYLIMVWFSQNIFWFLKKSPKSIQNPKSRVKPKHMSDPKSTIRVWALVRVIPRAKKIRNYLWLWLFQFRKVPLFCNSPRTPKRWPWLES